MIKPERLRKGDKVAIIDKGTELLSCEKVAIIKKHIEKCYMNYNNMKEYLFSSIEIEIAYNVRIVKVLILKIPYN